jgi:hypothetical protein
MSSNSNRYWNNRGYERAPLSEEATLLAKIRNGDFNLSFYQILANRERAEFEKLEAEMRQTFNGSEQDWAEAIGPYRRQSFVKVQRLLERAQIDEETKLNGLRQSLFATFGYDYWEELTQVCSGGPMELYKLYKEKANSVLWETRGILSTYS